MKIIVPPDLAEKLGGLTQADMISAWGAVPALVRFENNEAFPIWSVDPKTEDR